MYKKVLYNIKKMKKCGAGEGQYLNPKFSMDLKNKNKKKVKKKNIFF